MSRIHLIKSFSVFTLIGGVFFVLAVGLNALAIDMMGFSPALAPFVIMSVLFIGKYYCYLVTRIIVPSFWRYTLANLTVTLLTTLTIWLLVTYAEFSGGFATGLTLAGFFVLRYVVLRWMNVIRREA